jgi:hypothetical protein
MGERNVSHALNASQCDAADLRPRMRGWLLLSCPHHRCWLVVVLVSTTGPQMLTTFVLNLEHMLQNLMDGAEVAVVCRMT